MSLLLIQTFTKHRQAYQFFNLSKKSLSILSFKQQKQKERTGALATSNDRTDVSTDVRPIGERIKENTKTASYFGVIIGGIAITGVILFAVFRELFSSNSPNNVYSEALKICINVNLLNLNSKNHLFE